MRYRQVPLESFQLTDDLGGAHRQKVRPVPVERLSSRASLPNERDSPTHNKVFVYVTSDGVSHGRLKPSSCTVTSWQFLASVIVPPESSRTS
jgi:hypothetical protein